MSLCPRASLTLAPSFPHYSPSPTPAPHLQLGIAELPPSPPDSPASDLAFLKSLHDLVMDIHVTEGELVCPNCKRAYKIHNGIANMLLREDEV